jgi:hypothetical protein
MCAFIFARTSTRFCPLSFVFSKNDSIVSTNSAKLVESRLSRCPKFRQTAKSWTLPKTTHQKGT